jgi:hypothetical protein
LHSNNVVVEVVVDVEVKVEVLVDVEVEVEVVLEDDVVVVVVINSNWPGHTSVPATFSTQTPVLLLRHGPFVFKAQFLVPHLVPHSG